MYGPEPVPESERYTERLRIMTAGFALTFVILVRLLWPQGTLLLRRVFLPGSDVTTAALTQMAADIRAGENVGEAVTAFCRTVVAEEFGP